MNENPKRSEVIAPEGELQADITDLIQRFQKENPDVERRFGPVVLKQNNRPWVSCDGIAEPFSLSNFEYVIFWALVSVSRAGTKEGGIISTSDLHRLLDGVMRESEGGKKNTRLRSENGPAEWYEDDSVDDPNNIVSVLIGRIRRKLAEELGQLISIETEGYRNGSRGYYLKIHN